MTEAEFIQEVQNELTGSGALPVTVQENEIKRIMRQAERYFYINYNHAVQKQYYIIPNAVFQKEEFIRNRTLILPDCVMAVVDVREINEVSRLGTLDRDFSENKLIAAEIYLSSFHGDDLVLRAAQASYFDLTKAFFVTVIGYDFNTNTKKLVISGRNPKFDVFVDTWIKIEPEKLYDDYYFLRWVTATAKLSFARIVGTYSLQLPGNVQINFDAIATEGREELAELKEKMDNENQPDWFLLWH